MGDHGLVAEAEELVRELQQTTGHDERLVLLSRGLAVTQRIIGELERRVEAGEARPEEVERVRAISTHFEDGSREFAELLRHELADDASEEEADSREPVFIRSGSAG
jgi:hypothetical protein